MSEVRLQLLQNHGKVRDWSHRFIYDDGLAFEFMARWC
jgi:hypothetical protein